MEIRRTSKIEHAIELLRRVAGQEGPWSLMEGRNVGSFLLGNTWPDYYLVGITGRKETLTAPRLSFKLRVAALRI